MKLSIAAVILFLMTFMVNVHAQASFFDRPDYFENKKLYDDVEEIIEIIYDTSLSEHDKELRLLFKDKLLVPNFKALKVENERIFSEYLRDTEKLSDEEIAALMKERPVIDGFKFTMENDFLAGTDTYYTNGLRIEWSFNNPEFEKFFKKLGFDHSDFFFLCAQNMYNTSNNNIGTKRPDEPPNAGILYCGGAVNSYKMNSDKSKLRSMQRLEAQLGTIGQSSYAEQVQNGFHRLIGDKQVNWDYQAADRFYVNINFQKYLKLDERNLYGDSKPEYNVIVNAGGNAGTFTNFADAGVVINYRLLGTLIDMYVGNKMTPTLIEELAMMTRENRLKRLLCESNWSINLYFGAEARYVVDNYRIDGNKDYFTESLPFVVDLKTGVLIRYKKVFFDLGVVRRSSEWAHTNSDGDGPPHTYGMLNIGVRYDSFKDLGNQVTEPIRWIADPAYRQKMMEEKQFKDLVLKEGVKIIFDQNEPASPQKFRENLCH
ncbi:lipid A deacylase LpxR family protein [bacterium]|nr:lipid A deacylase LpxR family protein [bacterium]